MREDDLSEHDDRATQPLPQGVPAPWSPPEAVAWPSPAHPPPGSSLPGSYPGLAPPPEAWGVPSYGGPPPAGPWPSPGTYPGTPPAVAPPAPARSRRRRLLVGAAVVAALAVAVPTVQRGLSRSPDRASSIAAGTSTVPAGPAAATTAQAVSQRLLSGMTRAVRSGDQGAFTAAAAWGSPSVREHLQEVYTGLRALPLASFGSSRGCSRACASPRRRTCSSSGSAATPHSCAASPRRWSAS
jgi:hypothetical protein